MRKNKKFIFLLFIMSLFALFMAGCLKEARLYGVTTWDAGCPGDSLSWWDDMGLAWYNEVTDSTAHGNDAFNKDGQFINGNIVDSMFTDTAVVAWGNDHNEIDTADAAMIFMHGSENNDRWQGSVRVDEAGNGNCKTWQGDMRFGNTDLEFLHLSSCNSLDDNQWADRWWQSFSGLHQVDGFHGFMWIWSELVDNYRDFADDAFSTTIVDAWLDNVYYPDISGTDDQCPVAYAVGANSDDTWNRMGTERYNNILSDPTTVGYWGAIYIENCDPANEDVIGTDID